MQHLYAQNEEAVAAHALVQQLQRYFVKKLDGLSRDYGEKKAFEAAEWFRDEGRHGGGVRFEGRDETLFNRASVNVSQVQYNDDPAKKLGSATAISTIIHPANPHAPSMHMHISWTQTKNGSGYWRMMADLNPAIVYEPDRSAFADALKRTAPTLYAEASAQGDRYFFIPALERHRGVTHFYLENYNSGDPVTDEALAKSLGKAVIDVYIGIVSNALKTRTAISDKDRRRQLEYHTLYLFQVLTLDRGTTSGLLIHDQNDIGIMGSLPSHVDRELLASWIRNMTPPQDALLQSILEALPKSNPSPVETDTKKKLAEAVRRHYRNHPEALQMQASGDFIPPTVQNHR